MPRPMLVRAIEEHRHDKDGTHKRGVLGMRSRRTLALLATASFAVVLLALTGAANSATKSFCSKKPLCAAITSQDESSRSPSGSPHYFSDSAVVNYDTTNGATSNMTNIRVVITWTDLNATSQTSTYVSTASDPDGVADRGGARRTLVRQARNSRVAGE